MTGPTEPERLDGQRVSAGYFRTLGVSPAIGRDFLESDDQLNGPKVAILSDALWQRRFGGDSAIVGRQVRLDDNSYTVIGVMPSAFENVLAPSAESLVALQYDQSLTPAGTGVGSSPAHGRDGCARAPAWIRQGVRRIRSCAI